MAKKAFIVEYNIRTRVVVDVPDNYEPFDGSINDGIVIAKAGDKILSDAQGYIISDNIVEIEEDEEVPYNPEYDDKVTIWHVLTQKGLYTVEDEDDDDKEKIAYWLDEDEAKRFAFEEGGLQVWIPVDNEVNTSYLSRYVRMG